jgi:hypothetical protein
MRVEMVDVQGQLMAEIADPRMKRADVALTYAFGLRQHDDVDWPTVNRAIVERWSMAGLDWIKTRAWARVRDLPTDRRSA